MELKEPKRKRFSGKIQQSQSLPVIIESLSGITACNSLWPVYVGTFSGDSVIVNVRDEMSYLHNMGFFGKGSLSRGYPSFGETRKGIPPFIRERQWKRRKLWMDQLLSFTDLGCFDKLKDAENSNEKKSNKDSDAGKQNSHKDSAQSDNEEIQIIYTELDENITKGANALNKNKKIENKNKLSGTSKHNKNVDSIESKKLPDVNNETSREQKSHLDINMSSENKLLSVIENTSAVSSTVMNVMLGSSSTSQDNLPLSEQNISNQSNHVVVIDDSGSEDESLSQSPQPRLCAEPIKTAVETLNLTLEEAFFLSFGLGCLQVVDLQGIFLSLRGMWHLYKDSQPGFISSYITYHYFRSKGWVVKPGAKFGGNFLLYKKGPPFYHASYIVLIKEVKNKYNILQERRELTWIKIMGLNRIAETAGKISSEISVLTTFGATSVSRITQKQISRRMLKFWI
ncbi:tRNA splicing endonuclease subunit 2 isoform X2 [Lycorma delicatula]|uniref:tRNA splicing endonuclease subunit 2 isoform X2 n=1 Tax=Lycorma delicatula TaxID=130591 RepID=UPI003F51649C